MPLDVPDDVVVRCQVPSDRADWDTIMRFALTIDGYRALGQERLAEIANACRETGRLPDDLTALRSCLFYEQRRWRHFGEAPDVEAMRYIRKLVRAIRRQVGASAGRTVDDT